MAGSLRGTSFIPQMGQFPGLSRTISGCMGQVQRDAAAGGSSLSACAEPVAWWLCPATLGRPSATGARGSKSFAKVLPTSGRGATCASADSGSCDVDSTDVATHANAANAEQPTRISRVASCTRVLLMFGFHHAASPRAVRDPRRCRPDWRTNPDLLHSFPTDRVPSQS